MTVKRSVYTVSIGVFYKCVVVNGKSRVAEDYTAIFPGGMKFAPFNDNNKLLSETRVFSTVATRHSDVDAARDTRAKFRILRPWNPLLPGTVMMMMTTIIIIIINSTSLYRLFLKTAATVDPVCTTATAACNNGATCDLVIFTSSSSRARAEVEYQVHTAGYTTCLVVHFINVSRNFTGTYAILFYNTAYLYTRARPPARTIPWPRGRPACTRRPPPALRSSRRVINAACDRGGAFVAGDRRRWGGRGHTCARAGHRYRRIDFRRVG